ncbi:MULTISPECIES: SCO2524 family protein [unclassified Streptomyces]|uniref:SCO2524 family protein n=1 Tax=unclassified Streptomyces TaxID=2593676 RepID=UPI003329FABC
MQIKPRQHLLELWRAVARQAFENKGAGSTGESGLNSVADAERLLCLMYPATEIPSFRLDRPDTTDRDVLRALRSLGERVEIPEKLVAELTGFMRTHSTADGSPTFSGGAYFLSMDEENQPTPEQRGLSVVDAYSMSVTLCLATLGFLKVYENTTARSDIHSAIKELREATQTRLTTAMSGLLRSFAVNVFDADSDQGRRLIDLIRQGQRSDRAVVQQFARQFRALRGTISEGLIRGIQVDETVRDEGYLFECGWAWGVVRGAPKVVELDAPVLGQPEGVADKVPYVYFTVVALDGIQDLFSERTLTLGLLTPDQQKLAEALRLRWELSQQYWSGIARFGGDRWPLEDLPWQTTGLQLESDYFSLTVAAILVHDLVRRRATDDDLTRTVAVMERLADRGRITSRMTRDDPYVALHYPGVAMPLAGSERAGPKLHWRMRDFSAQLLKRSLQLAALSRNTSAQDRLLRLAESVFQHLWDRRIDTGDGIDLWDNVPGVYPEASHAVPQLSWSMTERVTECLVAARNLYMQPPIRSQDMSELAREALSEAWHLFGWEQLQTAPDDGGRGRAMRTIQAQLERARRLMEDRPATALALTQPVLRELDTLARARGAAEQEV